MGGEQPTAADLQVGSGLALLLTLGDIAPRVEAHECARVARRWFPDYPGRSRPACCRASGSTRARRPPDQRRRPNRLPRTTFTGEVPVRVSP